MAAHRDLTDVSDLTHDIRTLLNVVQEAMNEVRAYPEETELWEMAQSGLLRMGLLMELLDAHDTWSGMSDQTERRTAARRQVELASALMARAGELAWQSSDRELRLSWPNRPLASDAEAWLERSPRVAHRILRGVINAEGIEVEVDSDGVVYRFPERFL